MVDKILVVDDDPTQRRLLQGILEKEGLSVHLTASGHEAIDYLASPESKSVRVMLLDLVMPEIGGIEVLEKIRPTHENLPVIVLTAKGGIETVVQAMQAGANDFVVKPASPQRLVVSIQNALQLSSLSGEVTRLKRQRAGVMKFQDLIAKSPATQQVVRLGERAAKSSIPILIEGESGVGKEIIARAIQGSSDRAGRPFVTVNCGAIPENLVESILFGHEKGAFTGASEKHQGKFKEADGGTLFLDEIGELRLDIQVKLLRALQENEIDPIGARRPVKVDIRLISATNRDLLEMVREGGFREDLYYRLNVFPINVPPLRERPDDIPDLIHFFIRRFASEEKKRVVGIEREAMALLQTYTWPGNVRQLENAVFRAVVLSDGAELGLRDFPQIAKTLGMSPPPLPPLASAPSANGANGVSAAGVEHVADEASFADPKPHPFANVPLEDDPSCAEITVTNPDG
ncbi:MAG: sigma-54 dependent transcriptional regulator, partial [Pseudomonadota bacterium]